MAVSEADDFDVTIAATVQQYEQSLQTRRQGLSRW
jgi:hypothetical protein